MKQLIIKPKGWLCLLKDCPPGFFVYADSLCFKTEYGQDEVYCESGEVFYGGTSEKDARQELQVLPVSPIWVEK